MATNWDSHIFIDILDSCRTDIGIVEAIPYDSWFEAGQITEANWNVGKLAFFKSFTFTFNGVADAWMDGATYDLTSPDSPCGGFI